MSFSRPPNRPGVPPPALNPLAAEPAPGAKSRPGCFWAAAALIAVLAAGAIAVFVSGRRHEEVEPAGGEAAETQPPPAGDFRSLASPVPEADLLGGEPERIFQSTASSRLESALYGSTRTASVGRSILPSFHEGIDIAPTSRNSRGAPLDAVCAAADGVVRYVNRTAGNSSYGIYVVLGHADPAGECYSLYAHLAGVERGIAAGRPVRAGEALGRMGNTPSHIVPLARAHLHFEICLLQNSRFRTWFRKRHTHPDHGAYHGWNLMGVDPLAVFRAAAGDSAFTMAQFLNSVRPAFELAAEAEKLPDYFERYPALWQGQPYAGGPVVIAVSDGGVALRGRNASAPEAEALAGAPARVLSVDEEALGRNGRRIIIKRGGQWLLGRNGEDWLSIFLY